MTDKQFPPSIKRLNRSRREGKIAKSQLVTQALTLWAVFFLMPSTLTWVKNGTLVQWNDVRFYTPELAFYQSLKLACAAILLLVGVIVLAALASGLSQTRFLVLPAQLLKGFERYRPGAWLRRVRENSLDTIVGWGRAGVVLLAVAPTLRMLLNEVPSTFDGAGLRAVGARIDLVRSGYVRGAVAISLIATLAYALSRWRFYRQHRMSAQEVREEYREDEGDPHTRSHRRFEHRALLFSEVEKRVQRAKVVIVRRTTPG